MTHEGTLNFVHQSVPMRVVFGKPASMQIPAEADRLGAKRIMIACSQGMAQRLEGLISGLGSRGLGSRRSPGTPARLKSRTAAACLKTLSTASAERVHPDLVINVCLQEKLTDFILTSSSKRLS